MKIGYVRVSKFEQNEDLQKDALTKAGCERIFTDKGVSRLKFDRKELDKALAHLRPGDAFVVWRLDRLGGSLKELIEIVNGFHKKEVAFITLTEGFDTTTPIGWMMFQVSGAFAEYEVMIIRLRTKAGLEAARARGHVGGRKKTTTNDKIILARQLHAEGKHTIKGICGMLHISKTTLYRYLKEEQDGQAIV